MHTEPGRQESDLQNIGREARKTHGLPKNAAAGRKAGPVELASGMRGGLRLTILALNMFAALLPAAAQPAYAQTETVLYSFAAYSNDGYHPYAGLVRDKRAISTAPRTMAARTAARTAAGRYLR